MPFDEYFMSISNKNSYFFKSLSYLFWKIVLFIKFYKCKKSAFIRCVICNVTSCFPCFNDEYHSGSCDTSDNPDWNIVPYKLIRLGHVHSSDYEYIKHSWRLFLSFNFFNLKKKISISYLTLNDL